MCIHRELWLEIVNDSFRIISEGSVTIWQNTADNMSKENGRGPPLVTRSFKVCFPLQKIKTTNTETN